MRLSPWFQAPHSGRWLVGVDGTCQNAEVPVWDEDGGPRAPASRAAPHGGTAALPRAYQPAERQLQLPPTVPRTFQRKGEEAMGGIERELEVDNGGAEMEQKGPAGYPSFSQGALGKEVPNCFQSVCARWAGGCVTIENVCMHVCEYIYVYIYIYLYIYIDI